VNGKTVLRALAPAALAATAIIAPAATASAQNALPIGPNQYFNAQVNGTAVNAKITVVCPGPVGPTSTGHPISGQYVEVFLILPPVTSSLGFTGTAANQIDAFFGPLSSTANPPVVLKQYFVKYAIPTTLNLPCGGHGVVDFVPIPTSATARSYQVPVKYLNIGV
jgi:hypothetical protein